MWYLIENCYGDYLLTPGKTKKACLLEVGCDYKVKKIFSGAYEIETEDSHHIICKKKTIRVAWLFNQRS